MIRLTTYSSFHFQISLTNSSLPMSCRDFFCSFQSFFSTTIWVAIPAWSTPGFHKVVWPSILFLVVGHIHNTSMTSWISTIKFQTIHQFLYNSPTAHKFDKMCHTFWNIGKTIKLSILLLNNLTIWKNAIQLLWRKYNLSYKKHCINNFGKYNWETSSTKTNALKDAFACGLHMDQKEIAKQYPTDV